MADNNTEVKVSYTDDVTNCQLQIVSFMEGVQAQALLAKKLRKSYKQKEQVYQFMKYSNSILEIEIKRDEQKKESLLSSLEAMKSSNLELKKQISLAKDRKQTMIENGKNKIKKLKEHWTLCKQRFESIPYIQKYFQIKNKIETVKENKSALIIEIKKVRADINIKNRELFDLDKKHIVQLADFMINKIPLILKLINDKTNELNKLKFEIQIKEPVLEHLPKADLSNAVASDFTEAKDVVMKNTEDPSQATNNTLVLPKLQLHNIDLAPFKLNEIQKVNIKSAAPIKRNYDTMEVQDVTNKKVENINDVCTLSLFKSPTLMGNIDTTFKNETKKYSEKKLIHILEDVKLDIPATYKIISKLKPIHDTNINKAEMSQQEVKENKNEPSQEKIDKQRAEVIEVIDLTNNLTEDILIPPTQFLDSAQNTQEKRVTFSTVIEIEDSAIFATDDKKSQEDDVNDIQLNASTASDDSYKRIKNFVFTKNNLNLSPEFTYTKKSVVPMETENNNMVTSKFFNENYTVKDEENIDCTKQQVELMDIVDDIDKSEKEISAEPKPIIQDNKPDNLLKGQECTQNDTPPAKPIFRYLEGISDLMDISASTGFDDVDAEFRQCIDSSLLLSPKADDMQTNTEFESQSQDVPNFLTGLRKTGFSFFGTTASKTKPESDVQNQNNNFNFNIGGSDNEKIKRGGLFSMFH